METVKGEVVRWRWSDKRKLGAERGGQEEEEVSLLSSLTLDVRFSSRPRRLALLPCLLPRVLYLSDNQLTTIEAGTFSALGNLVLVRTYTHVWGYLRRGGTELHEAFDETPCPMPQRNEPQGEALAIGRYGDVFYTLSEGEGQPIWAFDEL